MSAPPQSLLSPPLSLPSILIFYKQLTWIDQFSWYNVFSLEVHIVFCLRPHDLQLHVLNFFNLTLYFSV